MHKTLNGRGESRWGALLAGLLSATVATSARANTDVPAFDARIVAVGGNGTALGDTAVAMYTNPAALSLIPKYSVSLTAAPMFPRLSGPAGELKTDGDHTYLAKAEQDKAIAPLYFVGGAMRVHDRVVVGLGNWISSGFGATFSNFGGKTLQNQLQLEDPIKLKASVAVGEVALGASYEASDQVSFGASYRVTYALMEMDIVDPTSLQKLEMKNFSGVSFAGFQLGMLVRPTKTVRVGVTYRSETQIEIDGKLTTTPLIPDPNNPARKRRASTTYATPHLFRAALAWQMHPQVLWNLGAQYLTYANRWKELELEDKRGVVGTPTPLQWRDVWGGGTGLEVRPVLSVPFDVRLGAQFSRSATNPNYPNVFFMTPGKIWGVSGGLGYEIAHLVRLDGAVVYNWGKGEGRNTLEDSGLVRYAQPPDTYHSKTTMGVLSITVQR